MFQNMPHCSKQTTQPEVQKTWIRWQVLSPAIRSLIVKLWILNGCLKLKMAKRIYPILERRGCQYDQSCRTFQYSKNNRKLPTTKQSALIRWTIYLQSNPIWNSPKSPSSSSRRAASRIETPITEQVRLSRMELMIRKVICLAVSFSCRSHQIRVRFSWHISWNTWIQTRDSSPRRSQ